MNAHWTIVIGPDLHSTEAVMMYWARKEAPSLPDVDAARGHLRQYDAVPFPQALRSLEGARPTRIVIVRYLQWRGAPGQVAYTWAAIKRIQAKYPTTKVTFLP